MVTSRVGNPDRFYPDPDPTLEKKPDPDPTFGKKPDPDSLSLYVIFLSSYLTFFLLFLLSLSTSLFFAFSITYNFLSCPYIWRQILIPTWCIWNSISHSLSVCLSLSLPLSFALFLCIYLSFSFLNLRPMLILAWYIWGSISHSLFVRLSSSLSFSLYISLSPYLSLSSLNWRQILILTWEIWISFISLKLYWLTSEIRIFEQQHQFSDSRSLFFPPFS